MVDKVFTINGNKLSSLIIDEDSLKFSSAIFDTVESFQEAYTKKLTLASRLEIKYDRIKYIRKEDKSNDVIILYNKYSGLPFDCVFTFNDIDDFEIFITFFEKKRYFTSTHEDLTPIKAVKLNLIWLLAIISFFIFTYYQAIEINNGTAEEGSDWKATLFNYIVGQIGVKGVLGIGVLVSSYMIYKTWIRFANPPKQLKLIPPNS